MSTISCPQCGKVYKLKPELVGRKVECKVCGQRFDVAVDQDQPQPDSSGYEMAEPQSQEQDNLAALQNALADHPVGTASDGRTIHAAPERTNSPVATQNCGKAIAALVCGILGLVMCAPVGIVAIFLGQSAKAEIAASRGALDGEGMAQAGVIIGYVCVALFLLQCVIFGLAFAAGIAGA